MKKYIVILIIALAFTSCSDFLNLKPENQINENGFYKTAGDFETAAFGMYSGLQTLHDMPMLSLGELTTDNMRTTDRLSNPPIVRIECNEDALTSTNSYVNTVWRSAYTTIAQSNNILSRIDNVDFDASKKKQFKGEALFLRAYCYFYLVRLFGDVPLVD
ncbi:MAG: RagB/SusD family nutrient uptake outer membrane protein, partial [Bacteroidota bacterium]|nr:RagB/SusD family nutrient uptake outer membrane protein [Bacteroidota bacterium]